MDITANNGISGAELAETVGKEWADYRFGRDGLFYLPDWRRGFEAGELRALFWQVQQVRSLERQARQATKDAEALQIALYEAERQASWYRGQLVLESRLGLTLARIAGQ